jgi:PTH1 family peptidyl-tRNA hydrolase
MLIVGLGNPGSEYQDNRHNVGFMAVDEIIRRYSLSAPRSKFKGELSEGEINGKKVFTIKPSTFMNKSGVSVSEVAKFYKIPPEDIYVLYDELDLILAKVKVKVGGGDGGHNGIKSIDSHIGKNYNRIRIGIDHPGHKAKVHSHVLGDFKTKEREEISHLLAHMADVFGVLTKGKNSDFTTQLALKMNPPKPKEKRTDVADVKKPAKVESTEQIQTKPRSAMDAALQAIFKKKD